MAQAPLQAVTRHLRELAGGGLAETSDAELLEQFAATRDQAAFAALLQRHGPMVFSVGRRIVQQTQDAEDIFQATFLLLAQRAGAIRKRGSVGCWLHGVAHRLALRVKSQSAARQAREREAAAMRGNLSSEPAWETLQAILDEELARLPEKYRSAVLLCCLEAKTQEEAARQLGCPLGTIRSRLARGRELLHKRLIGRGVTLSAAALATLWTVTAPASPPVALVQTTLRTAVLVAAGQTLAEVAAPPVAKLAAMGMRDFAHAKAKLGLGCLLAAAVCGTAGGLMNQETPQVVEKPRHAEHSRADFQAPGKDQSGDPLPEGAIARLGTTRFRHGDTAFDLAFTANGSQIASADWYSIHLWETATGKEIRRIGPRFSTSLRSVALSTDGKILASAEHHKGLIQLWDVATGDLIREFINGSEGEDRFCSVRFSPDDKMLATHSGKRIWLWDPKSGKELRSWIADRESVHCLMFSPKSKTLISGGDDQSIHIWDTATGKELRRIEKLPGTVNRLAISSDSRLLASVGAARHDFKNANSSSTMWLTDNQIHLWDFATGNRIRQMEAVGGETKNAILGSHPNAIHHLVFSPGGKILATAGQDRTIRIWDVASGKELRRWNAYWITSLAFSPDGKILASGSNDKTIRLWDPESGRELRPQPGHRDGVRFLIFSQDSRRLATASSDRTVRVWDTETGKEAQRIPGPSGELRPLEFSRDGSSLITLGVELTAGGADKIARIWDVATGRERRQLGEAGQGWLCARSTDGKTWAMADREGAVHLWDASSGKTRPTGIKEKEGIGCMAFSLDGSKLFLWSGDRHVHIWDLATGKQLRWFPVGEKSNSHAVAFSPDGRLIAYAGEDRMIQLFDMATGKELRRMTGLSEHWVSCLSFSPDGRTLASAGMYDPTIYLWEVMTGGLRHRLAGHQGRILTLVFSPDGRQLASGSEDTTALVWNVANPLAAGALSPNALDDLWSNLSGDDATKAQRAIWTLVAAPKQALPLIREHLKPVAEPSKELREQFSHLLADLDSDDFAIRQNAVVQLDQLGPAVEPMVRKALLGNPSVEVRGHLQKLLNRLDKAEEKIWLAKVRTLEALEKIATPEARRLLEKLAAGAPEARLTQEAKGALERLSHRSRRGD